jgi:hypothetical protein
VLQVSQYLIGAGILGDTPKELKRTVSDNVATALKVNRTRVRVTEIVAEKEGDVLSLQVMIDSYINHNVLREK